MGSYLELYSNEPGPLGTRLGNEIGIGCHLELQVNEPGTLGS